ncbi:hypothetical protein [Hymenobacter wooponensis]|uniref:Uncharacterized protein n=1 Tax=Hymenobacter wooponensis TaxID=1525360 RepID=A0A4Z0MQI7_9BACT|nr:hypothetical protein [Hymenobacter wooponensis]TGD81670.1 hypothetical protein EU557_09010 [Hymenobacter wooponensis]
MRYILYSLFAVGLSAVATTTAAAQTRPNEFWTEHSASAGTPVIDSSELMAILVADKAPVKEAPQAASPQHKLVPASGTGGKRASAATTTARRKRH